jgi:hypothetical protein
MPALYQRAGLFWYVFLPNAPRRYAVMLTLSQNQHREQKDDRSSLLRNDRCTMHGRKAALPALSIGASFDSPAVLRRLTNQN